MHPGLILVTGANGFIGRHLCRHLADRGFRVRGSVRGCVEGMRDGIDYRDSGDIHGETDWAPVLDGVTHVVHAAARVHVLDETEPEPRAAFHNVNVAGTERLARQALQAGVRRFILLSSIKAGAAHPDPYDISKREAEAALARVADGAAMETVVLRPPLVYGPGAGANFARLVRAVARGWPLPLASVRNRRSFLYVANLCSALDTCLTHPDAAGRVMMLSDGPPLSTPALIRLICEALGRPAKLLPCPVPLLRLGGQLPWCRPFVERLTGDLVTDDREIRERLGWQPPADTRTGLIETLAETPAARPKSHLAGGVFALYRLMGTAALPLVRRHMRQRRARGREDPARLAERFGHSGARRPPGPLVWIHGASIGESLSALPLIERVRADWPALNLLVTTGTVTSAKLMAERLPADVVHQYLPVDLPAAVDRFLDHWRPALGLIIESELWPNLLLRSRARGVDLVLVNGRVSPKSYASWRRVRPLVAHLLGTFSLTLAQSRLDLSHLSDLGAANARHLGNLKFAAPPLAVDADELTALKRALDGRPRWVAASTHPGEDEAAAEVHAALCPSHPGLLTMIVPRHPQRGADAAAQLRAQGRGVALRSAGDEIGPKTEIYVADTVGEMGLWYRLAEVAFVGGSLVPKGGQNLLEPAKLGCALLAGPHTTNFRRVGEDMTRAGALRRVADGAELAVAVGALLGDDDLRGAMIAAAQDYAAAEAGVLDDIIGALTPHLDRAVTGLKQQSSDGT